MRISDWSSDVCSSDLGFDAPNTNVVGLAGRTFAIVEAGGKPVEMSDTLDTIAHNPFDGTLAGPYTAHPHHDPFAGETHAIRSEERRVGKEGVSKCRTRLEPCPLKKKTTQITRK